MITALKEYATDSNPVPAGSTNVLKVVEYLEACHCLFEKGILSHAAIWDHDSKVLANIKKGFKYFSDWSEFYEQTVYPNNSKKERNKKFLSWQVSICLYII